MKFTSRRLPNVFPPLMKVPGDGKADAVGALLGEQVKVRESSDLRVE